MTAMHSEPNDESVRPPRWAEVLLRLLLPPSEAETVSGDLIEEYRDAVHPSRGRWGADRWLARQIAGFMWRSAWVWGLLVSVSMSGRAMWDTFAPPLDGNWGPRSAFTTYWVIALFVFAGASVARRTGRAFSGPLTALGAHIVGVLLGVPFRLALFVIAIQHDPKRLEVFYLTGGWGEEWGIPLMLVPIVLMLGSVGGLAGKLLGPAVRRPAQV